MLASPAPAQEGLVLSGGGSRGLAHVGVLEGLERLDRDPEIVVGVSMGALVGALYAAGYEPERIWRLVEAQEWGTIFSPPPMLLGPDRAARHPVLWAGFGRSAFRFIPGFVPDWRINHLLADVLLDANLRIRGDFDRLPRRYRAVATDLEDGAMVVLGRGDLARAARASMAVPGLFSPVEWEGRILVDGGIANNLPVSTARELGAEQVIAVEADPLSPRIEGLVPTEVVSRTLEILLQRTQSDQPAPDELVALELQPDISPAIFPSDVTPLLEAGLAAALRDLSPAPGGDRPEPGELPPPPSFEGVRVDAPTPALEALVQREFTQALRDGYDPARLRGALERLYATGLFSGIWPRAEPDEGGDRSVLAVRAVSPPQAMISGAAGYGNDRGARVWGAIQHTASIAGHPVLLSTDLSYDGLTRWGSAWARLYPLGLAPFAGSAGAYQQEQRVRAFDGDPWEEDFEVNRSGAWVGVEARLLRPDRAVMALLHAEWLDIEGGEGGASLGPLVRFTAPRPSAVAVGVETLLEAEARWGEIGYQRGAARGAARRTLGNLQMAVLADLALASGDAPPHVLPALGDDHLVPGLRWGERRGQARAVVGFDIAYPWILGGYARSRLRGGAAPDSAREWNGGIWVIGVEGGAFWETPLGQLDLGYGANTAGGQRLSVQVGARF